MNRPLLSICIPTYNKSHLAIPRIERLLAGYAGGDVEFVVADNASTDDTQQLIKAISDPRLRYIRRPENIGGIPNVLTILTEAKGQWAMLVQDRDYTRPEFLGGFIERLAKLPDDVVFGYVTLQRGEPDANVVIKEEEHLYARGLDAVLNAGYIEEHPTGMLVRTEVLLQSDIVEQLLAGNGKFVFNNYIMKAHLAMLGRAWTTNYPVLVTETAEQSAAEPSNTYSAQNAWFTPASQRHTFDILMRDSTTLGLTKARQRQVLQTLYARCLTCCTFGYRYFIGVPGFAAHNGVVSRKVRLGEMMREHAKCALWFLRRGAPPSLSLRIAWVLCRGARWCAVVILKSLKR